jgi:hypothetical protein
MEKYGGNSVGFEQMIPAYSLNINNIEHMCSSICSAALMMEQNRHKTFTTGPAAKWLRQ